MTDNQKVDNNLLGAYKVETEDQGSSVHRQVVKVGSIASGLTLGTVDIADPCSGTQTNDIKVTLDSETVEVVQDTAADLNVTEANSATIAGDTTSIDGKITACNTGAVVISSGTVTTITNDVSIDDGGNSITVDGPGIDIPTVIGNGQKTVSSAGTAEALGSSTAIASITIKALKDNTGVIYVGDSGVTSANGFELEASETISLDITDLATVYIDADTSSEGVSFAYVT